MRNLRWLGGAAVGARRPDRADDRNGAGRGLGGGRHCRWLTKDPPIAGRGARDPVPAPPARGHGRRLRRGELNAVNLGRRRGDHGGGDEPWWRHLVGGRHLPGRGNWQIAVAHSGLVTSEPTTIDGRTGRRTRRACRRDLDRRVRLMAIVVVGSTVLIGRGRRTSVATRRPGRRCAPAERTPSASWPRRCGPTVGASRYP